ncbi:leucine--tRNA ligase [Candidatus Endobugula sertula]|uniref:Leucine--tRNA ligase n=1 Tax=Candidatus Endobugula sertula TaxID=62101 RepID=A0A1D2QLK9_9GAMM|nr:leucine--tRNA ligase [Candidatus Endobugula sertula]
MEEQYHPSSIEATAQAYWQDNRCFEVTEDETKEKFYCLAMFPYPSGKLHMGHVRNYTITDVISRYQRMKGKNVLHPMGWDAFGLPAENAAIQNNTAPAKWTYNNIDDMKKQLNALGFGFDWSRELATCQPDYYHWEQWFFTRLYEKGLVYKKMATVNWDPVDQTVLANEQVIDGKGWRSGATVERKEIPQWFIKITDYAEELLSSLDQLPDWPEQVKIMQRNWIGKSRGVEVTFDLVESIGGIDGLDVYTTRPDTLMGVTYVSIAAEHPIAGELAKSHPELLTFVQTCKQQSASEADMSSADKQGMDTGLTAIHPLTGESVAIWIANYVLMDYGSGAVMAVPGHDERDFDFAQKFSLPIIQVIRPVDGSDIDVSVAAYTGKGVCVNSGEFDGMDFAQAFDAMAEKLTALKKGRVTTNFRLRDWGVSRQRYWGTPIPMFNLPEGGEIPVPAERLPVLLPEEVEMNGVQSPIKADPLWRKTEFNGQSVEHETDTFDTFMESSWYYARYTCSNLKEAMLDPNTANYWLPVDQYVGGIEHAILHLLYARFFHKLMRDEGLVDCDEPFERLLCQGMVLAETYYRKNDDGSIEWFNPADVILKKDDKGKPISATLTTTGEAVDIGGVTKMSKSKNNGVDPQIAVDLYGADTVRLFTMFAAPPTQTLEWSDAGVEGASRFLRRLWKTTYGHIKAGEPAPLSVDDLNQQQKDLRRKTHETIAKVTEDYGVRQQFNTAIAAVMELLNEVGRLADRSTPETLAVEREAIETAILLLAPVAPHIGHALWLALGYTSNVIEQTWPVADKAALVKVNITIVVQVNGRVRAKLDVPSGISKEQMETLAMVDEHVQKFTEGKTIHKVIIVPNKLVNIVAN